MRIPSPPEDVRSAGPVVMPPRTLRALFFPASAPLFAWRTPFEESKRALQLMLQPEDMHRTLSAAHQELTAAARIAKQRRAEIDLLPAQQRDAALDEYIAILQELEATAQALLDCLPRAEREQ